MSICFVKKEIPIAIGIGGAGNGTRTRDINLGKVALYQLSYSRISKFLEQFLRGKYNVVDHTNQLQIKKNHTNNLNPFKN